MYSQLAMSLLQVVVSALPCMHGKDPVTVTKSKLQTYC